MKRYKLWKKCGMAWFLALALMLGMLPASVSSAAKKVKLSKKSVKLTVGKSYKLKLKNNKKKASWKVTSGKKCVKLKAKKKTGVTIVAKKAGTAKVQAKVGKKKYTCKVKVRAKKKPTPTEPDIPDNTTAPDTPVTTEPGTTSSADVTASGQPTVTSKPGPGTNPPAPTGDNPTPTPGGGQETEPPAPTGDNPTPTPQKTPDTTGGNLDLTGKTVFTAGNKKLALGISRDNLLTEIGTPTRTGTSPQGFETIVYNPGGNYDGYTIVYLKDNVVVSICAIGQNVSYGNIVQTGTKADELGSGWSPETWFSAKEGEAIVGNGAYKYSASDPAATVLAYVDFFRLRKSDGTNTLGNKVYCIQAFSSTIAWDDMRYPANCHYEDPAVMTELKQETAELLIAYRKYICNSCDYSWTKYPLSTKTELAEAAQTYCDAAKTNTDAPPAEQNADKLKEAILAKSNAPTHFAQITMSTSSDAIGFANSALNQQGTSDYIINFNKTDKRWNNTAYRYWYQYFGIGATAYRASEGATWHTYMIIDLVDLWDGDPDW